MFVSSPEQLFTGEQVMEALEKYCREQPWQFKCARPHVGGARGERLGWGSACPNRIAPVAVARQSN